MAQRIRVGIVGATLTRGGSGWGADAHVPALKSLPAYQLKAVCTAHEATARAAAEAFGAELAFDDFGKMVARPDIDLAVVCVRVPSHYALVRQALLAGKATLCEWPLGAGLKEAQELAALARERSLVTMVGLQARSNPALMHARELVAQGYLGDVLAANLKVIPVAQYERGPGRIWQGRRANGANPLTIPGGHSLDSLRFILGEFAEVTARVTTRVRQWRNSETGENMAVDAPDCIAVAGRLESGAEASIQIATVPSNASGYRLEMYGSKGALSLSGPSANIGPNVLHGAQGKDAMAQLAVPERFKLAPAGTPAGMPYNVAQAYVRLAGALESGQPLEPDFDAALRLHRLIDAIERSSEERSAKSL